MLGHYEDFTASLFAMCKQFCDLNGIFIRGIMGETTFYVLPKCICTTEVQTFYLLSRCHF